MSENASRLVCSIPIAAITVVNPRIRNKKSFRELVENIAALGLNP
jgi:ParB family chromosome partitioning protein